MSGRHANHPDIKARVAKAAARQTGVASARKRTARVERLAAEFVEAGRLAADRLADERNRLIEAGRLAADERVERLAYTLPEAAKAIGRDQATLHRWIAAGFLRAAHVGRSTMITRAELDRLLAEGGPPRRQQARAAGGQFTKEPDGGAAR